MALAPQIILRCNPSAVQCNPTQNMLQVISLAASRPSTLLFWPTKSHMFQQIFLPSHIIIKFVFNYFHLFTICSSLSYPKMLSHLYRTRLKLILLSSITLCSFGKWVCTLTASIYTLQYRKTLVYSPPYCMFIGIMDTLYISVTYPFLTNLSTTTITLFCTHQLHLLLSNSQLTKLMLWKLIQSPSCIPWETNALLSFSNFI